ncbi:flagellar biosynthetic protein FliR [bacterium]|nr:flagellar biosynthetic protein FliR [bacterium]
MAQTPNLLNLLSAYNIVIFMLVFTRISGFINSAPLFSTLPMPMPVKAWFCAAIAFILYPIIYVSKSYIMPHSMPEFFILLLIEFFVGFLIGFLANLVIEGVRMTGSILSIQMGLSMSQALDPATGVSSTEISRIYVYLALLVFLATGAYQVLFISLFDSFSAIPMGVFPALSADMVNGFMVLFAQLFKIAFGIALPIFAVLLISDILLGMMNKMMPQMNIYMVALPVKIYIGYFLIIAFLSGTSVYMQGVIKNYIQAINLLFT